MPKKQTKKKGLTAKTIDLQTKKAFNKAKELGDQASKLLAYAKNKYESLDSKTKKRVLEGLAFTAGAVATAVVAKKVMKSKTKKTSTKTKKR